MNKKLKITIAILIEVTLVFLIGATFAYFYALVANSGDNIQGSTVDFDVDLDSTAIYVASDLIPLNDNLIETAITKSTNKCIDSYDYDVCSLYQLTLTNSGDDIILYPFITTTSSTYTTNLKCQLFDSSYNAISDIMTVSNVSDGKVVITNDSVGLGITISSNVQNYYLAIWLPDTSSPQPNDYSKSFSGTITFESANNGQLYADFST